MLRSERNRKRGIRMRLIDADKLIEVLHESLEGDCDLREDYEFMGIDEFIKNQPTAYDVDKVVEQLEEEKEESYADFERYTKERGLDEDNDFYSVGMKRAIEIVKGGGIK